MQSVIFKLLSNKLISGNKPVYPRTGLNKFYLYCEVCQQYILINFKNTMTPCFTKQEIYSLW